MCASYFGVVYHTETHWAPEARLSPPCLSRGTQKCLWGGSCHPGLAELLRRGWEMIRTFLCVFFLKTPAKVSRYFSAQVLGAYLENVILDQIWKSYGDILAHTPNLFLFSLLRMPVPPELLPLSPAPPWAARPGVVPVLLHVTRPGLGLILRD